MTLSKEQINNILKKATTDSGLEMGELKQALISSNYSLSDDVAFTTAAELIKPDIEVYIENKKNKDETIKNIKIKLESIETGENPFDVETNNVIEKNNSDPPVFDDETETSKTQIRKSYCCESGGGTKNKRKKRVTKKRQITKTRKWSKKYKERINCKSPRGFSQRQYCLAKSIRKNKVTKKK